MANSDLVGSVLALTDSSEDENHVTTNSTNASHRNTRKGKNKGKGSNAASSSSSPSSSSHNSMGKGSKNKGNGSTSSSSPPGGNGSSKGNAKGQVVSTMEIFSGSANLSKALEKEGFHAGKVDILEKSADDLSDAGLVPLLVDEAVCTNTKYAHLAPPCSSFSSARWPKLRTRGAIKCTT
jgi:hypothetical protein